MKYRLLPPAFKMIGISIILLTFLIPLTLKLLNIDLINKIDSSKEVLRQIVGSVALAGFLLVLLAKEKIEDEFTDFCRLTAFRFTFIFGLISIILNPIFNNKNMESSYHLLLLQCIFYLLIYYATKKGLIKYEK